MGTIVYHCDGGGAGSLLPPPQHLPLTRRKSCQSHSLDLGESSAQAPLLQDGVPRGRSLDSTPAGSLRRSPTAGSSLSLSLCVAYVSLCTLVFVSVCVSISLCVCVFVPCLDLSRLLSQSVSVCFKSLVPSSFILGTTLLPSNLPFLLQSDSTLQNNVLPHPFRPLRSAFHPSLFHSESTQ